MNKETNSIYLLSIGNTVLKTSVTSECKAGQKYPNHTNWTRKQGGIADLLANKMDCRLKVIRRDIQGYFILIKRTITQVTILNYTYQTMVHTIS